MKKILRYIANLPDWFLLLAGIGLVNLVVLLGLVSLSLLCIFLLVVVLPCLFLLRDGGFFVPGTDRKRYLITAAKKGAWVALIVSAVVLLLPLCSLLIRRGAEL